jgi:hypothetical protein
MRYEIFTAAKIHTVALWVMTPCSLVDGDQRFGETHSFDFKDRNVTVKTEAVCSYQTLCLPTRLHGVVIHKTTIWIDTGNINIYFVMGLEIRRILLPESIRNSTTERSLTTIHSCSYFIIPRLQVRSRRWPHDIECDHKYDHRHEVVLLLQGWAGG